MSARLTTLQPDHAPYELDHTPSTPIELKDAHYEDLREMIEHFDRKLDDILCKTEKHLLEVKFDIKEKVRIESLYIMNSHLVQFSILCLSAVRS